MILACALMIFCFINCQQKKFSLEINWLLTKHFVISSCGELSFFLIMNRVKSKILNTKSEKCICYFVNVEAFDLYYNKVIMLEKLF